MKRKDLIHKASQEFPEVKGNLWMQATPHLRPVSDKRGRSREQFTGGTTSLKSAITLARFGWPEGAAKVREYMAAVENVIARDMDEEDIVYDVVGDEFDIGRVMTGEPENALAWRDTGERKTVTIEVNTATSAGISSKVIERRGAVICALVDCLEKGNVSCIAVND